MSFNLAAGVVLVVVIVVTRVVAALVEDEYTYALRLRGVENRFIKCRETQRKVILEDMLYEQQAEVEQEPPSR